MTNARVMTDREREVVIKQIIGENRLIHYTLLLDKAHEISGMARKTADRIIRKMLKREIVSIRVKNKDCYLLKSDEAYKWDLPAMFADRMAATRKKLDRIEREFTRHSYDAQQSIYDDLCKRIDETIESHGNWVKQLDLDRGYEVAYEEIGMDIRKRLDKTKIDYGRKKRIRTYSRNVVTALMELGKREVALEERKNAMRPSAEREEVADGIRQLYKQIHILLDDTVDLESTLGKLEPENIRYWYGDTEVGEICTAIDYVRKQSVERGEAMSVRIKQLKEVTGEKSIPVSVENLETQVSALRAGLEKMDKVIREIETTGMQHKLIQMLDSKLSEAESNLEKTRETTAPKP